MQNPPQESYTPQPKVLFDTAHFFSKTNIQPPQPQSDSAQPHPPTSITSSISPSQLPPPSATPSAASPPIELDFYQLQQKQRPVRLNNGQIPMAWVMHQMRLRSHQISKIAIPITCLSASYNVNGKKPTAENDLEIESWLLPLRERIGLGFTSTDNTSFTTQLSSSGSSLSISTSQFHHSSEPPTITTIEDTSFNTNSTNPAVTTTTNNTNTNISKAPPTLSSPASIIVVAFQEVVALNAANVVTNPDGAKHWQARLGVVLNHALNDFYDRLPKEDQPLHRDSYVPIASTHLVGLAIIVWVRRSVAPLISSVRTGAFGVGWGNLGNKGSVGVSMFVGDTPICFVNIHIAAHQHKVADRNKHYRTIIEKFRFTTPCKLPNDILSPLPHTFDVNHEAYNDPTVISGEAENLNNVHHDPTTTAATLDAAGMASPQIKQSYQPHPQIPLHVLYDVEGSVSNHNNLQQQFQSTTPDLHILEHSYTILNGDMNYRLNHSSIEAVFNRIEQKDIPYLLSCDQLLNQQSKGNALAEFVEMPITFLPTYKYIPGYNVYERRKGKKIRIPSYCDRILINSLNKSQGPQGLEYTRAELALSDHKPVRLAMLFNAYIYNHNKYLQLYQQLRSLTPVDIEPRLNLSCSRIYFPQVRNNIPLTETVKFINPSNTVLRWECIISNVDQHSIHSFIQPYILQSQTISTPATLFNDFKQLSKQQDTLYPTNELTMGSLLTFSPSSGSNQIGVNYQQYSKQFNSKPLIDTTPCVVRKSKIGIKPPVDTLSSLWLDVKPKSGTLAPGEEAEITVTVHLQGKESQRCQMGHLNLQSMVIIRTLDACTRMFSLDPGPLCIEADDQLFLANKNRVYNSRIENEADDDGDGDGEDDDDDINNDDDGDHVDDVNVAAPTKVGVSAAANAKSTAFSTKLKSMFAKDNAKNDAKASKTIPASIAATTSKPSVPFPDPQVSSPLDTDDDTVTDLIDSQTDDKKNETNDENDDNEILGFHAGATNAAAPAQSSAPIITNAPPAPTTTAPKPPASQSNQSNKHFWQQQTVPQEYCVFISGAYLDSFIGSRLSSLINPEPIGNTLISEDPNPIGTLSSTAVATPLALAHTVVTPASKQDPYPFFRHPYSISSHKNASRQQVQNSLNIRAPDMASSTSNNANSIITTNTVCTAINTPNTSKIILNNNQSNDASDINHDTFNTNAYDINHDTINPNDNTGNNHMNTTNTNTEEPINPYSMQSLARNLMSPSHKKVVPRAIPIELIALIHTILHHPQGTPFESNELFHPIVSSTANNNSIGPTLLNTTRGVSGGTWTSSPSLQPCSLHYVVIVRDILDTCPDALLYAACKYNIPLYIFGHVLVDFLQQLPDPLLPLPKNLSLGGSSISDNNTVPATSPLISSYQHSQPSLQCQPQLIYNDEKKDLNKMIIDENFYNQHVKDGENSANEASVEGKHVNRNCGSVLTTYDDHDDGDLPVGATLLQTNNPNTVLQNIIKAIFIDIPVNHYPTTIFLLSFFRQLIRSNRISCQQITLILARALTHVNNIHQPIAQCANKSASHIIYHLLRDA